MSMVRYFLLGIINVVVFLFILNFTKIIQFTEPVPDYVTAVVECVVKIHETEPEGDILAFLTGSEEVDTAVSQIKNNLSENAKENCQF